jgi:hypothetical protein
VARAGAVVPFGAREHIRFPDLLQTFVEGRLNDRGIDVEAGIPAEKLLDRGPARLAIDGRFPGHVSAHSRALPQG